MKLKFNKNYFIATLILFLIEVAIAVFFEEGFIRHTFGDFLVVILLYCFFRSLLQGSVLKMAMATLGIAFVIEFLQLTPFLQFVGLKHNKWANIIFGNYFSIQDLVAYTLGIAVTLCIEKSSVFFKYFVSSTKS